MNVGDTGHYKFDSIKRAKPRTKKVPGAPDEFEGAYRIGKSRSELMALAADSVAHTSQKVQSVYNPKYFPIVALQDLIANRRLSSELLEPFKDAPYNTQAFDKFKKDFAEPLLAYAKTAKQDMHFIKQILKPAILEHLDFASKIAAREIQTVKLPAFGATTGSFESQSFRRAG